MADLSSVPPLNSALAGLTDSKSRGSETDDNGTNFVDVMMARVTARQHNKDDLNATVRDHDNAADAADDASPKWIDYARQAEPAKEAVRGTDRNYHRDYKKDDVASAAPAKDAVAPKADKPVTEKPVTAETVVQDAAPEKEVISAATATDVVAAAADGSTDVKAFKGLQKMAAMLLDAEKNGKLILPAGTKAILEKLAGTTATEPGQVLPLLQSLLTSLRKLEDGKGAADLQKAMGDITWPPEVASLFNDLQVNVGIKAGQPINLGKMIKALRALSHLAQSANKGDDNSAIPNTALLPLVLNQVKNDKKTEGDDLGVDAAGYPVKEKSKNSSSDNVLAADILVQSMNIPNSQQKPDLNNHSLNPMVNGTAKSDLSDLSSEAFARGAQQQAHSGGGAKGAEAGAAAALSGGKNVTFDVPKAEEPVFNPNTAPVGAATLSSRATASVATTAAASALPSPATQQVMVQIQKMPITKDIQLNIQLNPAELGKVDVKITIDQHGKATAQILAERPETLALLQKDGNYLERALQQAGLNSSAQDLHYSLKEQAQQRGNESGSRKRRTLFDGDEDTKSVRVDTHVREDGLQHRVNYHA